MTANVDGPRETESLPESFPLLSKFFSHDLIIDNKTSEPRDLLMTERTTLSWIKFGSTLSVVAIVVLTNFRIDTSTKGEHGVNKDKNKSWMTRYSFGIAVLFLLLSIGCYFISCISYFQSIYNYKNGRIATYNMNISMGFLFTVGVVLLIVNVVFIIKD